MEINGMRRPIVVVVPCSSHVPFLKTLTRNWVFPRGQDADEVEMWSKVQRVEGSVQTTAVLSSAVCGCWDIARKARKTGKTLSKCLKWWWCRNNCLTLLFKATMISMSRTSRTRTTLRTVLLVRPGKGPIFIKTSPDEIASLAALMKRPVEMPALPESPTRPECPPSGHFAMKFNAWRITRYNKSHWISIRFYSFHSDSRCSIIWYNMHGL